MQARSAPGAFGRLVPAVLLTPLLGSALGIDGGLLFQIFAIDNLSLSSAAIGTAMGLGVLSLPLQIRAARTPMRRAGKNLRLYFVLAALQAWVLAGLVATGTTGRLATLALGIAILAEINLSVLYAPSSQPLISASTTPAQRQQINSRIRALAVGLLATGVVLFAALSQAQRSIFLTLVGALALMVALRLKGVEAPDSDTEDPTTESASPIPDGVRSTFLVFSLVGFSAWPLFLVYTREVLWPEANLGLVGAVQLLGPLTTLVAWRSTSGPLARRALTGGLALLGSTLMLASLPHPVTGQLTQSALLVSLFVSGGALTLVRLSSLELIHRLTSDISAVRSFTMLDVVASTSFQAGLWISGLLIAASTRTSWVLDPYRIYLLAFTVASLWAINRLRSVDKLALN